MPSLTITHAGGSQDTISETLGWKRRQTIGETRKVVIRVDRANAQAANLERKTDLVELGSVDTVRLVDIKTGAAYWDLICYSLETDSDRIAPIPGGTLYEGNDQTLITDLVNDVPTWTVGTIANLTGPLSFVFNHASNSEALRRIEKNVPGELQWSNQGTVDYVDDLGSDVSATVTLSPSAGTLEGEIHITERGRQLDGTHVRVLGAHEGEAQLYANLVPSTDGASYANRVNYTTSRWSTGDTRDWDVFVNKDLTDQATLEEEAAALGAEIDASLVEATTTVVHGTVNLGDWVRVEKPDANLARDMRVHRLTERAGEFNDTASGAAVVDEVLLSTRTVMRQQGDEDLQDLNRFRTGYQGASVWGTPSGGYQAVTSTENYRLTFFYPDIVFENTAELYVESQPYRTFHAGAASGGGSSETTNSGGSTTETSGNNSQFDNNVIQDTGGTLISTSNWTTWHTADSVTPTSATAFVVAYIAVENAGTGRVVPTVRLENTTTGETYPDSGGTTMGLEADSIEGELFLIAEDTNGETLELQLKGGSGSSEDYGVSTSFYGAGEHTHNVSIPSHFHGFTIPNHTHPVNPGVSTFPTTTASGVDVLVNGSTEATNIGSGSFTATVDISGALNANQFNTIELTSDSTGWLYATAGLEAYRKIGAK